MNQGEVAIRVENLSKMYKVYAKPGDMFKELFSRKSHHKEFWALKDISFEVRKGEVVGVVGANGAGKSTLLMILAGTLDKTGGTVEVKGKTSAILTLGTGFHPEYTGRQNILLGGLCLGMTHEEVDAKMESIIDFSELHEVIDQPFKTYSSGMQARLSFATAISAEPEVLIIDEALAAGDAYFVSKCFQRIAEICKSGTTVFFVSHSIGTVKQLCSKAIWIKQGEIEAIGKPEYVLSLYEVFTQDKINNYLQTNNTDTFTAVQDDGQYIYAKRNIKIDSCKLTDEYGSEKYTYTQGDTLFINLIWSGHHQEALYPGASIYNGNGVLVSGFLGCEKGVIFDSLEGSGIIKLRIEDLLLGEGFYYLVYGFVAWNEIQNAEYSIFRAKKQVSFYIKRSAVREYTYIYEPNHSWIVEKT